MSTSTPRGGEPAPAPPPVPNPTSAGDELELDPLDQADADGTVSAIAGTLPGRPPRRTAYADLSPLAVAKLETQLSRKRPRRRGKHNVPIEVNGWLLLDEEGRPVTAPARKGAY